MTSVENPGFLNTCRRIHTIACTSTPLSACTGLVLWYRLLNDPDQSQVARYLKTGVEQTNLGAMMVLAVIQNLACHFPMLLQYASDAAKQRALDQALEQKSIVFMRHIAKSGLPRPKPGSTEPRLFQLIQFPDALVGLDLDYNIRDAYGETLCAQLMRLGRTNELVFAIQHGGDPGFCKLRVSSSDCFSQTGCLSFAVMVLNGCEIVTFQDEAKDLKNCLTRLRTGRDEGEIKGLMRTAIDTVINARATNICIGLQSLQLPALILCEILQAYFCMWPRIPFHCYWNLVVAVKHFREQQT